MTRINPIDLSFLLLERANRPNHMAAYTIFEKPKGQKSSFGPRLFDAYRHSQAAKPFNHKLKWLGTDVAAWGRSRGEPVHRRGQLKDRVARREDPLHVFGIGSRTARRRLQAR